MADRPALSGEEMDRLTSLLARALWEFDDAEMSELYADFAAEIIRRLEKEGFEVRVRGAA